MPTWIAGSDDDIPSIAMATGFFWKTIWDHANNASLKAERKNPNVLYPNDEVFVPELQTKTQSCASEQRHKFRRRGEPPKIKIKLMENGEPRANVPYVLEVEGTKMEGQTDANGIIETYVPGNAKTGKLWLNEGKEVYDMQIGALDPIDQIVGVQERLTNLGYDCFPYTGVIDAMTKRALVNFQSSHKLRVTGRPDQATKAKLLELTQ